MEYYSFEILVPDDEGHYNLFEKTIVNKQNLTVNSYTVPIEYEGRLDLICKRVHNNTKYIEEICVINNIINPFSVKEGTIIYYFANTSNYGLLYESDPDDNTDKDNILNMNKNKSTKKDKNRIGSPPPIKPDNLKQIDVNHSKRKITVINKFK